MKFDEKQIYAQLKSAAKDSLKKSLVSWRGIHRKHLGEFQAILSEMQMRIRELIQAESGNSDIWRELETSTQKMSNWLESLNYIPDDFSPDEVLANWRNSSDAVIDDLPENLTPESPKNSLSEDASLGIGIWKRFRLTWQKFDRRNRSINAQTFFRYYIQSAISEFIIEEWLRFLQFSANHLYQLHQIGIDIKNDFVFWEQSQHTRIELSSDEIDSNLQQIEKYKASVESLLRELNNYCVGDTEKFQNYWENLENETQKNWQLANHSIVSRGEYGDPKLAQRNARIIQQFDTGKDAWTHHFYAEKEDWRVDLELSLLQLRCAQVSLKTWRSVHQKISQSIIPAFLDTQKTLSSSLKLFQHQEDTELKPSITSEKKKLRTALSQEKLPHISDAIIDARINETLVDYLHRIKSALEILAPKRLIFQSRDLENLIPNPKTYEIPLKDLVSRGIFANITKEHTAFMEEIESNIQKMVTHILEPQEITEYNLKAALNAFSEINQDIDPASEAREIAVGGLERAIQKIQDVIEINRDIQRRIKKFILNFSNQIENDLQELERGDKNKFVEMKIRLTQSKTGSKIGKLRDNLLKQLKKIGLYLKKTLIPLGKAQNYTKKLFFRFKKVTGLEEETQKAEETISDFLLKTQKRLDQLPYVYKRIFQLEPTQDERFFVGRETEFDILRDDYENWKAGKYVITAVVGEKGSGNTTLVNFAERTIYKDFPVINIQLSGTIYSESVLFEQLNESFGEDVENMAELAEKLLSYEERKVCILENLQNLFLKTIDGFDVLERFLLFISRTYPNIYWVATCSLYSWRYLDKVVNISEYFWKVIFLNELVQEEIEEVIWRRHRASGYNLEFDVPEKIKDTRKFKKLSSEEEKRKYLRNMLFEKLTSLSAGNVSVATFLWLRSIRVDDDGNLVISPDITLESSFLYNLPDDELFALAAILQHGTLATAEFAQVFHLELNDSRRLLSRMKNKGILLLDDDGEYRIQPFLFRPVVQVLKTKNILH